MAKTRALPVLVVWLLLLGHEAARPDFLGAATPPATQDALHQVMAGDDLRLIAGYYYGDTRQWQRIWEANKDHVRNPNRIVRGTFLRIPDTTVPSDPYAEFVTRARRVPAPPPPVPVVEPVPAGGPAPQAGVTPPAPGAPAPSPPAGAPVPPAAAAPAKLAPPAPAKRP
jgi:hypothetical protein